jgi:hypothetical protein
MRIDAAVSPDVIATCVVDAGPLKIQFVKARAEAV